MQAEELSGIKHGTIGGYKAGCRCKKCNAARSNELYRLTHKEQIAKTEKKRRVRLCKELEADPNHRFHGTYSGYILGCRCEKCLAAGADYRAARLAKKLKAQRLKGNKEDQR